MKNKSLIEKLADKGIIGTWPPTWVPFFFTLVFAIFGYFAGIMGLNWDNKLYIIAGFSLVWGILHFFIVRKLRKR